MFWWHNWSQDFSVRASPNHLGGDAYPIFFQKTPQGKLGYCQKIFRLSRSWNTVTNRIFLKENHAKILKGFVLYFCCRSLFKCCTQLWRCTPWRPTEPMCSWCQTTECSTTQPVSVSNVYHISQICRVWYKVLQLIYISRFRLLFSLRLRLLTPLATIVKIQTFHRTTNPITIPYPKVCVNIFASDRDRDRSPNHLSLPKMIKYLNFACSLTGPNWTTTYVGAPYLGYQAKAEMAQKSSQVNPSYPNLRTLISQQGSSVWTDYVAVRSI